LLATRPIVCEHARGPSFQFSENDRAALAAQLKHGAQDPELNGFVCAGWFVSHTRTGIQLSESDLEIYNSFFPEQWQVTLVVRPGRAMSMRAGFFIREFDGTLRTEGSYLEFSFPDRLAAIFERTQKIESPSPERRGNAQPIRGADIRIDPGSSAVPALDQPAVASIEPEPLREWEGTILAEPPAKKKWVWLVVWAVVLLGLAIAGLRYFNPHVQPEPLGLALSEKDGVLQVQWNRQAAPVADAAHGNLDIIDGKLTRSTTLSKLELALGSFVYQRVSGDIEVRLSVESSGGAKIEEVSRYLGTAPAQATTDINTGAPTESKAPAKTDATSAAKTENSQALEQRRAELEQEVQRLKDQNAQQNARIQQLERTLRILQTRLGQK
jgi:ubiquinone biosynthesis protein UbiJ